MIGDIREYENTLSEAFTEHFARHKSKIAIFGFLLYVLATVGGARLSPDDKLLLYQLSGIILLSASLIKTDELKPRPKKLDLDILAEFYMKSHGIWGMYFSKTEIVSSIKDSEQNIAGSFTRLIRHGWISKGLGGNYGITELGWNIIEMENEQTKKS